MPEIQTPTFAQGTYNATTGVYTNWRGEKDTRSIESVPEGTKIVFTPGTTSITGITGGGSGTGGGEPSFSQPNQSTPSPSTNEPTTSTGVIGQVKPGSLEPARQEYTRIQKYYISQINSGVKFTPEKLAMLKKDFGISIGGDNVAGVYVPRRSGTGVGTGYGTGDGNIYTVEIAPENLLPKVSTEPNMFGATLIEPAKTDLLSKFNMLHDTTLTYLQTKVYEGIDKAKTPIITSVGDALKLDYYYFVQPFVSLKNEITKTKTGRDIYTTTEYIATVIPFRAVKNILTDTGNLLMTGEYKNIYNYYSSPIKSTYNQFAGVTYKPTSTYTITDTKFLTGISFLSSQIITKIKVTYDKNKYLTKGIKIYPLVPLKFTYDLGIKAKKIATNENTLFWAGAGFKEAGNYVPTTFEDFAKYYVIGKLFEFAPKTMSSVAIYSGSKRFKEAKTPEDKVGGAFLIGAGGFGLGVGLKTTIRDNYFKIKGEELKLADETIKPFVNYNKAVFMKRYKGLEILDTSTYLPFLNSQKKGTFIEKRFNIISPEVKAYYKDIPLDKVSYYKPIIEGKKLIGFKFVKEKTTAFPYDNPKTFKNYFEFTNKAVYGLPKLDISSLKYETKYFSNDIKLSNDYVKPFTRRNKKIYMRRQEAISLFKPSTILNYLEGYKRGQFLKQQYKFNNYNLFGYSATAVGGKIKDIGEAGQFYSGKGISEGFLRLGNKYNNDIGFSLFGAEPYVYASYGKKAIVTPKAYEIKIKNPYEKRGKPIKKYIFPGTNIEEGNFYIPTNKREVQALTFGKLLPIRQKYYFKIGGRVVPIRENLVIDKPEKLGFEVLNKLETPKPSILPGKNSKYKGEYNLGKSSSLSGYSNKGFLPSSIIYASKKSSIKKSSISKYSLSKLYSYSTFSKSYSSSGYVPYKYSGSGASSSSSSSFSYFGSGGGSSSNRNNYYPKGYSKKISNIYSNTGFKPKSLATKKSKFSEGIFYTPSFTARALNIKTSIPKSYKGGGFIRGLPK